MIFKVKWVLGGTSNTDEFEANSIEDIEKFFENVMCAKIVDIHIQAPGYPKKITRPIDNPKDYQTVKVTLRNQDNGLSKIITLKKVKVSSLSDGSFETNVKNHLLLKGSTPITSMLISTSKK